VAGRRQRVHTRFPGTLTVQVEARGERRFATISEVSLGGAFVDVVPTPLPGTRLLVRIVTSSGETVTLPAEVRFARREEGDPTRFAGVGISWRTLDPEQLAFVEDLVARAARQRPLR
jgi:hypothetical protein